MKVDFVVKGAWVFMTYRQCFEKRDVAVAGEKIYAVSPAICYPDVTPAFMKKIGFLLLCTGFFLSCNKEQDNTLPIQHFHSLQRHPKGWHDCL